MRSTLLFLAVSLLLAVGCQRDATNPVENAGTPENPPGPAPALQFDALAPDLGLMGHFQLELDPAALTATLLPDRTAEALGDSFLVSGENFFRGPLCHDCLTVEGVRRDGSEIVVAFNVRHPYQPGNLALPPSATNRLDLDVFDLALAVEAQSPTMDYLFGMVAPATSFATAQFRNSDGVSLELQNVLGQSRALPYYLVVDDSDGGVSTNNRFAMGDARSVDVALNFELGATNPTRFALFLTMGYGASATRPTRLTPQYYLPEFNKKAAWKVAVLPPPAVAGQTWEENDPAGHLVQVQVWDWQAGATVDPALDDLTDVRSVSEVLDVSLELANVHNALVTVTTPSSGSGVPGDPFIYFLNVPNTGAGGPGNVGTWTGCVRVRDTRTPATPVAGPVVDGLIHANDDLSLSFHEIPEYATYQTFFATVLPAAPTCDPITVNKVRGSRYATVGHPYTYAVDPVASPAASHTYDWDNGQNTPGTYDDFSAVDNAVATMTWTAPGTYTVGCRVTPAGCPPATTTQPLVVTVYPDGTYVDRDNLADPAENGSWDHPFDAIGEGVTAAGAGGRVYIDAAAALYPAFTMTSNRTLTGIDRFNAGTRPTVTVTANWSNNSISTVTLRGLGFDMVNGFMQCFSPATWTLDDCRFTSTVTTGTSLTCLTMFSGTNITIQGCEWTDVHHASSGTNRLIRPLILTGSSSNVTIRQCEFHDIGYTVPPPTTGSASDIMDVIMSFGTANLTVTNCLFYDINMYMNPTSGYSYTAITNTHSTSTPLTWTNNTVDDVNIQLAGATGTGTTELIVLNTFLSAGAAPMVKNNIVRSQIAGPTTHENLTGFSGNCCVGPYPVNYSLVHWGPQGPGCVTPTCPWSSYRGNYPEGTGCIDHTDGIDPAFDLTLGATFYHPTAPQALTGGEGGTSMGCFGGALGTWTPPSQR